LLLLLLLFKSDCLKNRKKSVRMVMRFTRTLFAEKCREEEEFEPRLSK